mgnify:CR=1 FL=1
MARDTGACTLECIVLCNLGMVYDGFGPLRRGPGSLRGGAGHRPRTGGTALGRPVLELPRSAARPPSRISIEARRCLDSSETLLRAVSDRMSLGILLCGRAETEHLAGVPNDAKAALEKADVIAAEVGAGPDSELGLALARARNLLSLPQPQKLTSLDNRGNGRCAAALVPSASGQQRAVAPRPPKRAGCAHMTARLGCPRMDTPGGQGRRRSPVRYSGL